MSRQAAAALQQQPAQAPRTLLPAGIPEVSCTPPDQPETCSQHLMRAMRALLQQQHLAGGSGAAAGVAAAGALAAGSLAARLSSSSRQAPQVSGLACLREAAGCAALHRAIASSGGWAAGSSVSNPSWRPVAQPPPRAAPASAFSSSAADASSDDDGAPPLSPPQPPADGSISSTSNRYIKHAVKLRSSGRYRGALRRGLVVGETLLAELAGEGRARAGCGCVGHALHAMH